MSSKNIESGEIKICRGYVASATKSGITFGKGYKNGSELKRLQELIIEEALEDDDIILSRLEFAQHHGQPPDSPTLSLEELNKRRGYHL